jgi:hypothetical protein
MSRYVHQRDIHLAAACAKVTLTDVMPTDELDKRVAQAAYALASAERQLSSLLDVIARYSERTTAALTEAQGARKPLGSTHDLGDSAYRLTATLAEMNKQTAILEVLAELVAARNEQRAASA